VLLGGKLGRHPRLAKELPGLFDEQDVIRIVEVCLTLYKKKSLRGKGFAEILTDDDFNDLVKLFSSQ
jgi:dissimilatory sulfite reductase (desulfoviridin) alpha/beta subunit